MKPRIATALFATSALLVLRARLRWCTALALSLSLGLVLSLGAVLPAAAAPLSRSPAPQMLTGEHLTIPVQAGGTNCNGGGSFSFSVSGTAAGPYNGTFTETGNGTIDGSTNKLTFFTAKFTINSAQGDVTGTKTILSGSDNFSQFACYQESGHVAFSSIPTTYQATITTLHGNYTDHGTSTVSDFFENQGSVIDFDETFASSQGQIAPTSKDQCKHSGWQTYPQFKNQGQCVSFVEHNT